MIPLPEVCQQAPNLCRAEVGPLTVWTSYGVPVAFRHGARLVVRRNDWGTTTGKHLNAIDGGDKAARVDERAFAVAWQDAAAAVFK